MVPISSIVQTHFKPKFLVWFATKYKHGFLFGSLPVR
ncbi:hypothetical protein V6N13_014746 [Hibiscus sabdariffa]